MESLRYGGVYTLPDGIKVVAYSNGAGGYVCYKLADEDRDPNEPEIQAGSTVYMIDAQGRVFRLEKCEGWTLDSLTDTGRTGHVSQVA
jgi:hypothetical protein